MRWLPSICALFLAATVARAGSPRANFCYPGGGQRGTEQEVTISGGSLQDARALLFDDGGIEATITSAEGGKAKAKMKIAADARLGEHRFRVVTSSGISDVRLFIVSPFPMIEEQAKEKGKAGPPQPIPLNTTVYGRTQGDDQDKYVVEAKAGQRLTAEAIGARLHAREIYDAALLIAKEDGTKLAEADDASFARQDPIASVVLPEDGRYVVTIRHSTNTGDGECHYLLHIGSFAQPLAVYPAGGATGSELKVKLLGDAAGAIEQAVKLPDAATEEFAFLATGETPTPMPNPMRVSAFPNALEQEPNDTWEQATATETLPMACNGIIEKKGDTDFFRFTAKKAAAYDVNVYARQLRSPLDSVLGIYGEKGNRLQENDDDGQPDSHLRWTAPQDGTFFLSVADQLGRGGPLFTYRVEIKPVEPALIVSLPEMVPNSNQERRAIPVPKGNRYATLVRLKRSDTEGNVQLSPIDLPPGVGVSGTAVEKSADTVPVVFEAAEDAALAEKTFSLEAKLAEPPKDAPPVRSLVAHAVDIAENGNQKAFYSITESALPLAVTDAIPVKISLAAPKVPILQNGAMNLRIHADRQGDFKGPVTLTLLYAPPGIGSAGSGTLKEGESDGTVSISANDKAPLATWKICVVGTADFGKGPVWFSTALVDLSVAAPFVAGKIERTFVDQGDTGTVTVKLDPKVDFEGKAKIALQGLPSGVTAEEQEVSKGDAQVKFTIKADAKAAAGQHRQLFCQFKLQRDGEEMLNTFAQGGVLRVDKATVAQNTEGK